MQNSKNHIVQDLIIFFGSQENLGKAVNVSQSAVSQWLNFKCGINERNSLKIEKITKGRFKAIELCPALAEIEKDSYKTKD